MKYIRLILNIIKCVYSFSADPELFGSKNRREEKSALASEFKGIAADTQKNIDIAQAKNPFESAAAKSAMARTKAGSDQMQKRMLNVLGSGATAESAVASQGAASKALGAAAGQIATGAEAMKKQEVSQLRGLKAGQQAQYSGLSQAATNERGSGWRDLFSFLNPLGAMKGGVDASQ